MRRGWWAAVAVAAFLAAGLVAYGLHAREIAGNAVGVLAAADAHGEGINNFLPFGVKDGGPDALPAQSRVGLAQTQYPGAAAGAKAMQDDSGDSSDNSSADDNSSDDSSSASDSNDSDNSDNSSASDNSDDSDDSSASDNSDNSDNSSADNSDDSGDSGDNGSADNQQPPDDNQSDNSSQDQGD